MTILPSNLPLAGFSSNHSRQESAAVSLTLEQTNSVNSVKLSASYSNSVTISGGRGNSQAFEPGGIAKYQAIADAPKTTNAAADNILKLVSARLANDSAQGAAAQELESRLAAALEGFEQGYREAYEQLSASGFLNAEIDAVAQQTYDLVTSGIDQIAEQYGITSPLTAPVASRNNPDEQVSDSNDALVSGADKSQNSARKSEPPATAEPVDSLLAQQPRSVSGVLGEFARGIVKPEQNLSSILEGVSLNYEIMASRDFRFTLKTQDGDDVLITAASIAGERRAATSGNYAPQDAYARQVNAGAVGFSSNQFSFSVDGNLDDGELDAIANLLTQIADLSASFFAGDIQQAVDQALAIGFDSSEIANFSLNLQQQVTTIVEATYTRVESGSDAANFRRDLKESLGFANGNNSINRLANFISMLEDLVTKAEEIGIEPKVIPEFSKYIAGSYFNRYENSEKLASFLDSLVANKTAA